jgi:hypothetical protein
MKIIDKTPLQDANGNISLVARIQGTLKYGLNWFAELESQKAVIAQLDRSLEKGFVLIRNFTLPNSEIVIPIILIGTGGIWVIYVTKEKGSFEAKGDQWNTVNADGKSMPASINLIDRVSKLSIVMQKYLQVQKIEMPNPVDAVLIAADPGAHVSSTRPAARVVMSDAVKQFASSLLQARPIWRPDFIHEIAERIIDPRPPSELKPVVSAPAGQPAVSPAADEQENSFNANEYGFAFDEPVTQPPVQNLSKSNLDSPQPSSKPAPAKKRFLGLGDTQIILLAGMLIIECCVLFGFGVILYMNL